MIRTCFTDDTFSYLSGILNIHMQMFSTDYFIDYIALGVSFAFVDFAVIFMVLVSIKILAIVPS